MAKSFNVIIRDRCAKITTDMNKINDFIHETAMMIVRHAAPEKAGAGCSGTGDCTHALMLVKALPASMRRTMLIDWFGKYTPITVKLGDSESVGFNAKYHALKTPEAKLSAWDVPGANAEPFYLLAERTPEEKVYDFKALVEMVTRLGKQIEKKIEQGKVPEADVESAKGIARAVSSLHFQKVTPVNENTETTEEPKTEKVTRLRRKAKKVTEAAKADDKAAA